MTPTTEAVRAAAQQAVSAHPDADTRTQVITCACGAVYESDYPCACPVCGLNRCGACENGLVDSGGVTPWGAAIDVVCPDCNGTGALPKNPACVLRRPENND